MREVGDEGAPGLVFLMLATPISHRLVHHSRSMKHISGGYTGAVSHVWIRHTDTKTHTHKLITSPRPHKCS